MLDMNSMDRGLLEIFSTYRKAGKKAYIVGGAVRNSLMGLEVSDYDLVTDALPEETMSLFRRTVPTGIKHGTVTVIIDDTPYEITTMRTEDTYSDNRHPDAVNFVTDIREDLKRRDFTVNAMAYDPDSQMVIDIFNGQKDIEGRLIRCVGDPDRRFKEDALRMIRAVRFASTYGFNIDPDTFRSMTENSHLIGNVSAERIYQEFTKILLAPKPSEGIALMLYSGLLKEIVPELLPMAGFNQFSSYHDKDVFWHTMEVMNHTDPDLVLRLAALFHDSGKPHSFTMSDGKGHFYGHEDISAEIADKVLRRLRSDNRTRELVVKIIEKHMVSLDIKKEYKIKNLIRYMDKKNMDYFFRFKVADFAGKPMEHGVSDKFMQLKEKVDSIIGNQEPLEVTDLAIKGEDLKAIGIMGKEIGTTLEELLDEVLKNKDLNRKSQLIDMALRIKERNSEDSKQ